jgi:cysteine-rich repeat protein
VIAKPIVVVSGSELDFDVRALRIAPGGRLEIGAGSATIRCGSLTAAVPGAVAVLARGRLDGVGQAGGTLSIESRGTCARDRFVACFVDDECTRGPCEGGRCAGARDQLCNGDGDCDLGTCNPGSGISIVGKIDGQGVLSGAVSLLAAGDIVLNDVIDLDSTAAENDGGQLDATSTLGSISVPGRIDATSGRLAFGGIVTLSAARDVTLSGMIDVSGGDFDGGEIDVTAGRDITIVGRLRADATGGAGSGGFIGLDAGRDLRLRPSAQLSAHGSRSTENFGGDGGVHALSATRDITIEWGASVAADGAQPDGFAGEVEIAAADGDVVIGGNVVVKARGGRGGGGVIDVSGCSVDVATSAMIENGGQGGENAVTVRTSLRTRAGSKILADKSTGANTIVYRDPANTLLLQGTVDPAPTIVIALDLPPCVRCGNAIVEPGETCDDGNTTGGDGCSEHCQDEKCIEVTPGYPEVGLCDDRNECTLDVCITGAGCTRQPIQRPCDDGLDCTDLDACVNARCRGVSNCGAGFFCSRVLATCVLGSTTTTSTLPSVCGDGVVGPGEDCDDGDAVFVRGQACSADCGWVACGDPDGSGSVTASDALILLRVAVGVEPCASCVCDVDGSSGPATASDALRMLRSAVGLPVALACPPCQNP